VTSSVHYSSDSAEWATPRVFFKRLDAEFNFTLDVCATAANTTCRRFFAKNPDPRSAGVGGLVQPWLHEVCFCNPPYGRGVKGPAPWLEKATRECANGALVVCLLAARTDTRWFHRLVWPVADEVRFVEGRLAFNEGGPAPFPSMVVVYRPR